MLHAEALYHTGQTDLSWLKPTSLLKQETVVADPPLYASSVTVDSRC
jgi:hypothetical protein